MAQTKRKRTTKHRGNAAGMVEARGRTGRKSTAAERKDPKGGSKGAARPNRLDNPPTWSGSFKRAGLMTVIFVVVVAIIGKSITGAAVLAVFMLAVYTPMSYYTDLWMHRRRLKQKAEGKLPR